MVQQNNINIIHHANQQWILEWKDTNRQKQWDVGNKFIPMFKFCKKRKEFFTQEFAEVWYKSPYKYHMNMNVKSFGNDSKINCHLDLCFENGQPVVQDKKQPVISKNEKVFDMKTNDIKLGPFQFNVCSYKYDAKKFRLQVILSVDSEVTHQRQTICILSSPPFIIKAKKPIAKPGIKSGKKRTRASNNNDEDSSSDVVPPTNNSNEGIENNNHNNISPSLASSNHTTNQLIPNLGTPHFHSSSFQTNDSIQEALQLEERKKYLEQQILRCSSLINAIAGRAIQKYGGIPSSLLPFRDSLYSLNNNDHSATRNQPNLLQPLNNPYPSNISSSEILNNSHPPIHNIPNIQDSSVNNESDSYHQTFKRMKPLDSITLPSIEKTSNGLLVQPHYLHNNLQHHLPPPYELTRRDNQEDSVFPQRGNQINPLLTHSLNSVHKISEPNTFGDYGITTNNHGPTTQQQQPLLHSYPFHSTTPLLRHAIVSKKEL
ncbi:hypothetical protein ABK040_016274 [Willaertia magna]